MSYSVIINNNEVHTRDTKEEAIALANQYKHVLAEVGYWPDKRYTPEIVADNRKARIQHYTDNCLGIFKQGNRLSNGR